MGHSAARGIEGVPADVGYMNRPGWDSEVDEWVEKGTETEHANGM